MGRERNKKGEINEAGWNLGGDSVVENSEGGTKGEENVRNGGKGWRSFVYNLQFIFVCAAHMSYGGSTTHVPVCMEQRERVFPQSYTNSIGSNRSGRSL